MGHRIVRLAAIGLGTIAGGALLVFIVGVPIVIQIDDQMRAPGDAAIKARVDRLVASLPNGTPRAAVIRYLQSHRFRGTYVSGPGLPMYEADFAPQTQLRVFGGTGILPVVTMYDVRIYYDGKDRVRNIRVRRLGYGP